MTGEAREEWEMGELGTSELLDSDARFDSVGSGFDAAVMSWRPGLWR